ncbi:MAG: hypothetical protein AAB725_02220 [Patescibacteria group bacterium]
MVVVGEADEAEDVVEVVDDELELLEEPPPLLTEPGATQIVLTGVIVVVSVAPLVGIERLKTEVELPQVKLALIELTL